MRKNRDGPAYAYPAYIEWDTDAPSPGNRGECASVESLFDAEIRRRIGEVIARAADGVKNPKNS
jgi:hypothetical protein